jgi:hypothetical protein
MASDSLERRGAEALRTTKGRRKLRFDDWDDVLADAEMLKRCGYDHASYGTLTLGQITSHLATVLSGAVDGFPKLAPWPLRVFLRLVFLNKMQRHEPSNLRIKSPNSLAPPEACEDDVGIAQLRTAIERFRHHQGDYHPHMAFGTLSRQQWKHQQLWHCEHHLSFLQPKSDSQKADDR